MPFGSNRFGAQYERVLPASSVSNLYPFNFSGRTDPKGFYIGRDKYGTNILVDLDRRSDDKTNGNSLILGNSGQGKSHLLKLLLTNLRESGKSVICLDVEHEYEDLTTALGGSYIDFLSGKYLINVLEPKIWSDEEDANADDTGSPEAFRRVTRLSQHIAFLTDKKVLKAIGMTVLVLIVALLLPLMAMMAILSGDIELDTTDFSLVIFENCSVANMQMRECQMEAVSLDASVMFGWTSVTAAESSGTPGIPVARRNGTAPHSKQSCRK